MGVGMSDPPRMIWLQWHDNPEVTWEHEKIHNDDIEYVLASDKPNDTIDTVYQENRALEARIEELEKQKAQTERIFDEYCAKVKGFNDCHHHITNDQIDAAVLLLTRHGLKMAVDLGWLILGIFHIFRCEGCDCYQGMSDPARVNKPCPDCDGHGWVIGGRDE
jgi:hypothetical protein